MNNNSIITILLIVVISLMVLVSIIWFITFLIKRNKLNKNNSTSPDKINNTQITNYENQIQDYQFQLKMTKLEIENKNKEIENLKEVNKKEKEFLLREKNYAIELLKNDKELEIKKINEEYEKTIKQLKNQKGYTPQEVGANLEEWINNEYQKSFGMHSDCEWEYQPTPIPNEIDGKRTKPDFVWRIFSSGIDNKQEINSIVIEAKNKSNLDIKSIKNNTKILKTLQINQDNHNADISLLVTNLDEDNDFFIKKIENQEYKNMYACRPEALIPFLSMVYSLYKRREKLIEKIKNQGIKFQEETKILENFELLKKEILDNQIKHINTKGQEIQKKAETIERNARDIIESLRIMLKHLGIAETKITNFGIEDIVHQIYELKSFDTLNENQNEIYQSKSFDSLNENQLNRFSNQNFQKNIY
ncbi:DUF2130 domain-containing protein [Mycoplasmoides pirum]|uniref:DUF2130 domain-containing protein n=1 Tax=Mycoplasmoides pirum TaxID=2122 RepID=UPI000484243F|nr:DUF2130 domain-containing protein [Mycoplasmoides pirum]